MNSTFQHISSKKSVLIIDDDTELAHMYGEILAISGYMAVCASNLTDAYAKLDNQKFNLIVVDLQLGRQNGEKIISTIRKDLAGMNVQTPIIVCSGRLTAEVLKFIRPYVNEIMVKPVSAQTLLAKAHLLTAKGTTVEKPSIPAKTVKGHVLVADDDVEFTDNVCSALRSLDYIPTPAYEMSDIKQKLSRQKFDCILLDRHLGERDGSEIVFYLRTSLTNNKETPVIMVTGDMSEELIKNNHDYIQGFIRKPINLQEIPRYIENVCKLD